MSDGFNNTQVSKKTAYAILKALMDPKDLGEIEFLRVVLLAGLPGSGKSTVSKLLYELYGFERLSTDQIRTQDLFPDQEHRLGREHDRVMMSRYLVYEELARRASRLLMAGKRVVIDGTNMDDKRWTLIGSVLSHISVEQLAFIVLQPPEWIMRRRFRNASRKDYEQWWSIFKYWRGYMKDGKATYPTPTGFPRIRHLYVKRYALRTFDWVPNIKGIIWRLDESLLVEPDSEISANDNKLFKTLSSLTQLRDFVLRWTDDHVWFEEVLLIQEGELALNKEWEKVLVKKNAPKEKIYASVAKQLKMKPGQLLVVADNEKDSIIPAKLAGMRTCMVGKVSREADVNLKSVQELGELFGIG